MKVTKAEGGAEIRLVLTGMIASRHVIAQIASQWGKHGLFEDKQTNQIGSLCVDYYNEYGKSPGRHFQTLFAGWAKKQKPETVESVSKLIAYLSDSYKKKLNPEYVIDVAQDLFKKAQARLLHEAMEEDISEGDYKKLFERIRTFDEIKIDAEAGVDFTIDRESRLDAMETRDSDIVIRYPDALGVLLKDTFSKGHLVSFMGPEKSGKTHRLIDVAYMGVTQGQTVAFFGVGDMSKKQMIRRFIARICGRPVEAGDFKYPEILEAGNPPQPILKTRKLKFALSNSYIDKRFDEFVKEHGSNKIKLFAYPNSTMSINGIKSVLLNEKRKGFVPDIVVIDYADILAPINGTAETRDQINATWKGMRALAYDLCVVTATQSNKDSYDGETMEMSNFSEDKRKLAHANAIIGIIMTGDEKKLGMSRLNLVVARENEFSTKTYVYCAGSLAISNPNMHTLF